MSEWVEHMYSNNATANKKNYDYKTAVSVVQWRNENPYDENVEIRWHIVSKSYCLCVVLGGFQITHTIDTIPSHSDIFVFDVHRFFVHESYTKIYSVKKLLTHKPVKQ